MKQQRHIRRYRSHIRLVNPDINKRFKHKRKWDTVNPNIRLKHKRYYNTLLWKQVMELGKQHEKGMTNKLDENDVATILETMEIMGATDAWQGQTIYDLQSAKYKVYDWLAMSIMGRNDDDRETNNVALKVLVFAFIKADGNPEKFIDNLRDDDYHMNKKWEDIQIEEE